MWRDNKELSKDATNVLCPDLGGLAVVINQTTQWHVGLSNLIQFFKNLKEHGNSSEVLLSESFHSRIYKKNWIIIS